MSKKPPSLTRRTYSIYRHQAARAAETGVKIPYTLEQFRRIVRRALSGYCRYCGAALEIVNFSADHRNPVGRYSLETATRAWAATNLVICCRRCNETKGSLTGIEYLALRAFIDTWEAPAKQDVYRRLRAGGRIRRG